MPDDLPALPPELEAELQAAIKIALPSPAIGVGSGVSADQVSLLLGNAEYLAQKERDRVADCFRPLLQRLQAKLNDAEYWRARNSHESEKNAAQSQEHWRKRKEAEAERDAARRTAEFLWRRSELSARDISELAERDNLWQPM